MYGRHMAPLLLTAALSALRSPLGRFHLALQPWALCCACHQQLPASPAKCLSA